MPTSACTPLWTLPLAQWVMIGSMGPAPVQPHTGLSVTSRQLPTWGLLTLSAALHCELHSEQDQHRSAQQGPQLCLGPTLLKHKDRTLGKRGSHYSLGKTADLGMLNLLNTNGHGFPQNPRVPVHSYLPLLCLRGSSEWRALFPQFSSPAAWWVGSGLHPSVVSLWGALSRLMT